MIRYCESIKKIIIENRFEKFAEIGVYESRTIKTTLRSECSNILKEYWAIDPWMILGKEHGHMSKRKIDFWDSLYFKSCSLMLLFKQLRVIRATSDIASKLFAQGYFDFVFIDGCHFYEYVLNDIKNWLPLVRKGGVIAGHDYGMGIRKGHNVKQAVIDYFGDNIVNIIDDGVWYRVI